MEVIFFTGKLKNTVFHIVLLYFTQTLSVKGLACIPHTQQSSHYYYPFQTLISTHPEHHLGLQISSEKNLTINTHGGYRRVRKFLYSSPSCFSTAPALFNRTMLYALRILSPPPPDLFLPQVRD